MLSCYRPVGLAGKNEEQTMRNAVVENPDQFYAFLASQPLCKWSAQKQREMATELRSDQGSHTIPHAPKPKDDNADLAAALAMLA